MFINDFGQYSYKSLKHAFMFGYEQKPMNDGRTFLFATPEKALVDLLYLYPFYNSRKEIEELRLDEGYLHEGLNMDVLQGYCTRLKTKALDDRLKLLLNIYGL